MSALAGGFDSSQHLLMHDAQIDASSGQVQMMLERETVAWSKGMMVLPPAIGQILQAELVLLSRLTAMELTVLQQPLTADAGSDMFFR